MMTECRGSDLGSWLTRAEHTGLKQLRSLARGLRQDFDAVAVGLTLEWSSSKAAGPDSTSSDAKSFSRTEHRHLL
jgi:transposase